MQKPGMKVQEGTKGAARNKIHDGKMSLPSVCIMPLHRKAVILKLFSLRRHWKSFLDFRRTSVKMLINTYIINVIYM